MEPEMLFHLSTLSMLFMNICSKWLFYLEQNCGGPWNLYHPSPAMKQFIPGVTVWIWNAPPSQAASSTLGPQRLFSGGWRLWEVIGGRSMELANSVHFLSNALLPGLLWREETDTYSCSCDLNHSLTSSLTWQMEFCSREGTTGPVWSCFSQVFGPIGKESNSFTR